MYTYIALCNSRKTVVRLNDSEPSSELHVIGIEKSKNNNKRFLLLAQIYHND